MRSEKPPPCWAETGKEGVDAEPVEVGKLLLLLLAVHLVHGIDHGFARGPQPLGNFDVGRQQSLPAVHEEDDDVRLLDGERGLLPHLHVHGVFGLGFEPAGVHEQELLVLPLGLGVVPVPGDAGHVLDDGEVPADDPVEEGGFADIGPADYGDDRFGHDLNACS